MIRSKIIYSSIIVFLIILLCLPAKAAIKPQPKIELDQYEMEVSSTDNIYVEGSVSLARGQWITLHTSTDSLPINFITTPNSNRAEDFKIKVPKMFLKEGTNVFHVMSKSLKNKVSASNFKTITIKVNTGTNSSKKNQTITASNKTLVVGQTANLGAKASSGLKLTYTANNQNATIDSNGKIIARKVGTTKVTIKQTGNSTYNSVSKTITITIKPESILKKAQKITASNKTINVGKSTSLGAKSSSKLKLTYKSSNPKIASVTSKGVVTGKKAGKTTITIKQAGNSKFKAATKKVTVVVNKNTQKIVAKGKIINVGKSISLGAKTTSKLKLTYKSSNSKVASVNSKGVVKGLKAGKSTITIKQKGNYKFKSTSKNIVVTVKNKNFKIIYYGCGGKFKEKTYESVVVSTGRNVRISECNFTKSGHTFRGWALSKNGKIKYKSNKLISVDSLYKHVNKQGTVKLYAIWKEIKLDTNSSGYLTKGSGKWNLLNYTGSYGNIQALATDGEYLYVVARKGHSGTGKVFKFRLSTKKLVRDSSSMYMGHSNDMTYNAKDGCLYITRNGSNDLKLVKVTADKLKKKGNVKVKIPSGLSGKSNAKSQVHQFNGIAYRDGHLYARAKNGASIILKLNDNYKAIKGYALKTKHSSAPAGQGMDFKGKTLYVGQSKYGQSGTNLIAKGKLTNRSTANFKNTGAFGELEGVFTYNNTVYFGLHKGGSFYIRKLYY